MSGRPCVNCGASLEGLRADARYCNDGCGRAYRHKRASIPEGGGSRNQWVSGYWRRRPRQSPANRPS